MYTAVFEMLDSLPDVDLESGIRLRREEMQGTFVLEDVVFAYQMRPNERVLDGVNLTVRGGSTYTHTTHLFRFSSDSGFLCLFTYSSTPNTSIAFSFLELRFELTGDN